MKIIFAGTPDISAEVLKSLINSKYEIIACLTQPDRPKGRGQKLEASPVKQIAQKNNIPILQPISLKDSDIQEQLTNINADLMIVLAYGLILPKAILTIPRLGCINIHASILPKWRGASPIQHAILSGDTESGITMIQMDPGMDTGDILTTYPCNISPSDTSQDLYDNLTKIAQDAIINTLDLLVDGKIKPTPQDGSLATLAPKITKAQAVIDWQQSAKEILQAIKAYNPWPVAFSSFEDKRVRFWDATISDMEACKPGEIVKIDKQGLHISAIDGCICATKLQFPGKKVLPVAAICNANKDLVPGGRFSSLPDR